MWNGAKQVTAPSIFIGWARKAPLLVTNNQCGYEPHTNTWKSNIYNVIGHLTRTSTGYIHILGTESLKNITTGQLKCNAFFFPKNRKTTLTWLSMPYGKQSCESYKCNTWCGLQDLLIIIIEMAQYIKLIIQKFIENLWIATIL